MACGIPSFLAVLVSRATPSSPRSSPACCCACSQAGTALSSSDFNPSSLGYPSSTDSSFRKSQNGPHTVSTYTIVVKAYDQSGNLAGTSNELQGAGQGGSSANLFILIMEIPLFQVPALGISASNPDFSNLFSTFDQLPIGDFYMLLAEVAVILLVGAGLINVILYLTGASEIQKGGTAGTLAGMNNVFVTLLLVLLLPFAYNAVAGFVNVLDQQIIAGPGNPYTAYLANSQLIWGSDVWDDQLIWGTDSSAVDLSGKAITGEP